jgi:capsule polysaccharide export protein KpsE/RkpR
METKTKKVEPIDLSVIIKKIWAKKKLFFKVLSVVFVVSCIYIVGIPRTYTSSVSLAPELGNSLSGTSTLGSIASAFGFDLENMQTDDAITPLLYPDLMNDNGFVAGLFDIQVQTLDGEINTSYFDYLQLHQKQSIWSIPLSWFKGLFKSKDDDGDAGTAFNPYQLSKSEDDVAEAVRGNINFSFDKKTGVIGIRTSAQDPLVCKILADSVQERLQHFITDYRTSKARIDYEYYKQLTAEAWNEYRDVRQKYGHLSDANTNVVLRSTNLELEDLENDMQQKYTAYTTFNTQLQAAKARIQERTPAFTVIQGASVPLKAAKPKRMIFVMGMMILAFFAVVIYVMKDDMGHVLSLQKPIS